MSRAEYLEQIANFAHSYGFVPIPLREKIPVIKNWQNSTNNPDQDAKDIASGRYPSTVRRVGHLVGAGVANNVGVVTGRASGVVVIDIDVADDGLSKWEEMVRANGVIPKTFTVRTGSGGKHYYFRYTEDLRNIGQIDRIYRMPFDYRTDGGMVVFPGSVVKGKEYAVEDGYVDNYPIIAEMPIWIKTLLVMDRIIKKSKFPKSEITIEDISTEAERLGVELTPIS